MPVVSAADNTVESYSAQIDGTSMLTIYSQSNGSGSIKNAGVGIASTTPWGLLSINPNGLTGPAFVIGSSTATKLIVTNDGSVGIATTSPWRTFSVDGTVSFKNLSTDTTVGLAGAICLDANNQLVKMSGSGTCVTSSRDYKKNITNLDHGLDWVRQMNPVTFNYKSNNQPSLGFIAEDMDTISPLLTARNDDGKVYTVRYELISAVLTKAVKELDTRLTTLEGLLGSSTSLTANVSSSISGFFEGVGATFENGFARFNNLFTQEFTVGSSEKPTGITLYDTVTGNPYCLKVANGATVTVAGDCGATVEPQNPVVPDPGTISDPPPVATSTDSSIGNDTGTTTPSTVTIPSPPPPTTATTTSGFTPTPAPAPSSGDVTPPSNDPVSDEVIATNP